MLENIALEQDEIEASAHKLWQKSKRSTNFELNLRYCPEDEVHAKMRKILDLKYQFALRIKHLKDLGKKLLVQGKLERWIDNNIDKFWEDPDLSKTFRRAVSIREIETLLA